MAIFGMVFGPWVTVKLFSSKYTAAGNLVGQVLWLMIPLSANHAMMRGLIAKKLDFHVLFCAIAGAAFFCATISLAVLRYGVLVAIWSAVGVMLFTTLFLI